MHCSDFVLRAPTEDNLRRCMCVCVCACSCLHILTLCHQDPGIHLAASPLQPDSLHFLLCLAELSPSSIKRRMNWRGSHFFCLWQLFCVFLQTVGCLFPQVDPANNHWINLAVPGPTRHISKSDCFPAHKRSLTDAQQHHRHRQGDWWACTGGRKCINVCVTVVHATHGLTDVNLLGQCAEASVGRKKAEQWCSAIKGQSEWAG